MNRYTCPHCKKPYYSAAEPENWRTFDCPNCGKEIEDETIPRTQKRTNPQVFNRRCDYIGNNCNDADN
jgi:DNA-directed RNA polymerase subunit RPC12/RpoP